MRFFSPISLFYFIFYQTYSSDIAEGNTGVVTLDYPFLNIKIGEEYLQLYHGMMP